jgi:hypothetical protein
VGNHKAPFSGVARQELASQSGFSASNYTREAQAFQPKEVNRMEWVRPDFEEVSLCCEINCYATAEL